MSDSPAAILYDENGNPVGVSFDGAVYRLQVEGKVELVDESGDALQGKRGGAAYIATRDGEQIRLLKLIQRELEEIRALLEAMGD